MENQFDNNRNDSEKPLFQRLRLGLLLGFLVFIGLVLMSDLRELSQTVSQFDWRYAILALLFTLFNYGLRFIKWHFYLGLIGAKDLGKWDSLRLFVGGFPLAVTPGKVGEAVKGVWVNRLTGVPVGKCISVVIAERITDGLAVLGLSVMGVIAYPNYAAGFIAVLCLLLGIILVSQVRPLAIGVLNFGAGLPVIKKYISSIRDLYEGSYSLFRPTAVIAAVGLGAVSWLGEGVGFYFILRGLGLEPGWNTLSQAVFILSFSTIIGAVSALPGGLGAAELTIAGMLAFLVGVEGAVASSAAILIRLATLWFGVSLGLVLWSTSPQLFGIRRAHAAMVES